MDFPRRRDEGLAMRITGRAWVREVPEVVWWLWPFAAGKLRSATTKRTYHLIGFNRSAINARIEELAFRIVNKGGKS